jgi:hypothetical protein
MDSKQAWEKIIDALRGKAIELPTVPKTLKSPIWFSATTDGTNIYINVATFNKPSTKISAQRTLSFDNFCRIYPIYLRRENGEQVSQEAASTTFNQVYYYSLIKNLAK